MLAASSIPGFDWGSVLQLILLLSPLFPLLIMANPCGWVVLPNGEPFWDWDEAYCGPYEPPPYPEPICGWNFGRIPYSQDQVGLYWWWDEVYCGAPDPGEDCGWNYVGHLSGYIDAGVLSASYYTPYWYWYWDVEACGGLDPNPECGYNTVGDTTFWYWDETLCGGPDPGEPDPGGGGAPGLGNNRRSTLLLHMASKQWIDTPGSNDASSNRAPKITGRHETNVSMRQLVDVGGRLYEVSLVGDTNLYQEGRGAYLPIFDADIPISSVIETGWMYPNGPNGEALIKTVAWYHGKWAEGATLDMIIQSRRDKTEVIQDHLRTIRPDASSVVQNWVFRGGQAFKVTLRHVGPNESLSGSTFGPIEAALADLGIHQEE